MPRDSFVGRDEDLDLVRELLQRCRLVTVTGGPGTGKTRLALEVARRLTGRFNDGIWHIDLAALDDPAQVVPTVRAVLGQSARGDLFDASVDLHSRRLLLVLDNCEHLTGACADLVDAMLGSNPGASVLATSQQRLGTPGETLWRIGPLSLPAGGAGTSPQAILDSGAGRLFCDRATAANPGFCLTTENALAVADVCRRLDGLPMGIELAAGRVVVLSVQRIAAELGDGLELSANGPRTLAARHQSLRAVLDWSYNLLSPPEQALLRRLSVFAGRFGLDSAKQVCGDDQEEPGGLLNHLTSLITKSLVLADTTSPEPRYALLETVRSYARRLLVDAGEDDLLKERHARWCLAVIGGPKSATAASRHSFESEVAADDLASAVEWSTSQGKTDVALPLAIVRAGQLARIGEIGQGRSTIETLLDHPEPLPPRLEAQARCKVAMLAMMTGDLAAALSHSEVGTRLAREHGGPEDRASALAMYGFVSMFAHNAAAAIPLLEESVQIARGVSDADVLCNCLSTSGHARLLAGDLGDARERFEECVELAREHGSERWGAAGLVGLARVLLATGDFVLAEASLRAALDFTSKADERYGRAMVLSLLGEVARLRGDDVDARACLEEGLAEAQEIGTPFPATKALTTLGNLALERGELDLARARFDHALCLARQAHLEYVVPECLQGLGAVANLAGDLATGRHLFEQALDVARRQGDKRGIAASSNALGTSARLVGDHDQARSLHFEALSLYDQVGDGAGVGDSLEALAFLALDSGNYRRAVRLFSASQTRRGGSAGGGPSGPAGVEAATTSLRAAMGDDAFTVAWNEGSSMSLGEVVAYASRGRGARARPPSGWESLTPTERRVVARVAEGLTNSEIAASLFLSPRTVNSHLSKVYPKLGIRSRKDLAEEARRHGQRSVVSSPPARR